MWLFSQKDRRRKPQAETVSKYDFEVAMLSDVGCVRETNEDSARVPRPMDPAVLAGRGLLLIVADGMGGHAAGEVASRMAVDSIERCYYEDQRDVQVSLQQAFLKANREVFEAAQRSEHLRGMGTTCTALVLKNGHAFSAHVGDTRLYLIRGESLFLMTEDHSQVMEMVRRGLLTLEQARRHEHRNVILRALGSREEVQVSMWQQPFPLREGDRFLLCSDGLHDLVEDEELKQMVRSADAQTACQQLISLARERGGRDNITAVVAHVKPLGTSAERPKGTREADIRS